MLVTPTFKGDDKVRIITKEGLVKFEIVDEPELEFSLAIDKGIVGGSLNLRFYVDQYSEFNVVDNCAAMGHFYYKDGKSILDKEFDKLSITEKLELVDWDLCGYGVADTIEQILSHGKRMIDDCERSFIVSVALISKKDQPERGGWRWHKWGPYIGVKKPQAEYIADEPDIEEVLIFEFIEVKPKC